MTARAHRRPRIAGLAMLWVRGSVRRPLRGLLVVGGLLASALAVTAALVAADSLNRTLVGDAMAQWGRVDVAVSAPGNGLLDEGAARLVGVEGQQHSKAWAGRLILPATAGAGGDRDPHARVIGVSEEERGFAEPLHGEGTLRTVRLAPDEVIVNERLAGRLGLAIGDRLDLVIAVPHAEWRRLDGSLAREREAAAADWRVRVAGIARDNGLADLGRTPNVLTRLDSAQRATELSGKVSTLHAAASSEGPAAADRLVDAYADLTHRFGLAAVAVKQEALAVADDESGQFVGIFASLALLVLLGSVALTVNLLVLLGYERSQEIALLRAAGARRSTVIGMLLAEGAVYTLVATAAGTVLALPLGNLLAGRVTDHFAGIELGRGREFLAQSAGARPGTVAIAIGVIAAVSLLTVFLAARRIASLDVERVLRGHPPAAAVAEPSGLRRPLLTAAAGLLLAGMGITATAGKDFLLFAGLSLLLTAWWLHARRDTADRIRLDSRAAIAGLLWCVAAPAVLGDFARGVESGFALLAVAGAGAVTCATLLVGTRLRTIMRLVRGYLPRGAIQAATRTAAAWAEHHRVRAGTVIGLVAVTLFMVAVMSVLGRATAIDVDRQSGGFDVIGTAVGPLDPADLAKTDGLDQLVALEHTMLGEQSFAVQDAADSAGDESRLRWPIRLIRAEQELAGSQSFGLADALPRYPTAAAAIRDAGTGRGVVLDRYSRPEGAQPGDTVLVENGTGAEEFELLAVLDTYLLGGALIGAEAYDAMLANRGPTMLLASAAGDADSASVADSLTAAAGTAGLTALTADQAAAAITRINATFTDIFSLVLQVGLCVALVAVAALVSRALRERRAEFALLRATGFRRADLMLAALAEPLLLGLTGIGIGVVAGIGTLALLFWTAFPDLAFHPHWGQIGGTAALCAALIIASCAVPVIRAVRRDPGSDLRDVG